MSVRTLAALLAAALLALLGTAVATGSGSSSPDTAVAETGGGSPAGGAARTEPPLRRDQGPVTAPAVTGDAGTDRAVSGLAPEVTQLGSAIYDERDHAARAATPVALAVETIGVVFAPVVEVGVEPTGEMEIPGASEVGWYRFGPAPGEAGSTVLAAHIAYDRVDGVFRHLADVEPGAEVAVAMSDGTRHTYRIRSVDEYAKDALPAAVWADDGASQLVLITCGGDFNPSLRSYDSNVVAWADPV